ncbi:hypothetical protein KOE73_07705 [Acidomonas methanolica]|uniref:Uncharacterized protein n=2 Tax=Acidomonas methanolica TaxID=437 RepID=A0A023D734_ACIMT|nr:hypothetical protein [Acidomonas methanolica]TCS29315.1 hypothetical protein EDC31_10787 [Acidomonas methanolica]GAJ29958.1 hypothetical protein Amme_088_006 [Acidomonas methanolica NBRC 104435]GBQ52614.1 hypothetical protein AA0498_1777 [Acidomonas methanolica]GEL00737.1 hypothetical protein AME01nite_32350 [Acidomonas methanolica NBRC 104435]
MEETARIGPLKDILMRRSKRIFLDHLALTANVTASARVAGVERGTIYHWRDADPVFAAGWADALEAATDALEAEARRRAVEGVEEPILSGGKVVADPATGNPLMRRRYSDGLMRVLLRAHRPSRFREMEEKEGRNGEVVVRLTRDDDGL